MTLQHYMKQPRSILCSKLERKYNAQNDRDFDYNFLPYCFRHIGFQPSPLLNILSFINGDSERYNKIFIKFL